MTETEALLILNAVKGIGNRGTRELLKHYGSATKILSLNESDFYSGTNISAKVIENILHFSKDKFLETEYNLMRKQGVGVTTLWDDQYPDVLKEIADAPIVLYVKGKLEVQGSLSIAIVGSRKASFYGSSVSEKFAAQFARLGFTVVSGMARGIDTAVHHGVLDAGGKTIAVLGCGLNNVYPAENKKLLERIAQSGAVVSEFPMQMEPLAFNFPRRNRLISGLSLGVIVVEAAQRSGALITADFALEQGRDVFAVPGRIDQGSSCGSNNLIKQGAKLITCVEDVLQDLQPRLLDHLKHEGEGSAVADKRRFELSSPRIDEKKVNLSKDEEIVLGRISDRPVHIDELTDGCGAAVPIMSILLQLEMKQLIKQLPGKLFTR